MPDAKGKALIVGSASSKQLSVKPDQSWEIPRTTISQREHFNTILTRFLSRYIHLSAEKQAGKGVHKLLSEKKTSQKSSQKSFK